FSWRSYRRSRRPPDADARRERPGARRSPCGEAAQGVGKRAAMAKNAEKPVTSFPKDQIKVLLLENIHASAHEIFAAQKFQVESVKQALKEEDLAARIRDVHLLGIRSKTQLPEGVLKHGKRLLSVGCFCIGTNQVDVGAANRQGVPVFNAPFSNTRSVAELM